MTSWCDKLISYNYICEKNKTFELPITVLFNHIACKVHVQPVFADSTHRICFCKHFIYIDIIVMTVSSYSG